MIGMGTIVNVAAVIVGATLGLRLKKGLEERYQQTIMSALGLATLFLGITGTLKGMMALKGDSLVSMNEMFMIVCMVVGALIGEAINIDKRLENFGTYCKGKFHVKDDGSSQFVEAFVNSSLLYCVGAMTIVGALEDGMMGNASTLYTKSILDGISSIIFAAALGVGVYLSVITLAVYQGGMTLLASVIKPYFSEELIGQMSFIGSILIFAVGINLVFDRKLKLANMLPAMFMPIIYQLIVYIV